MLPPSPTAPPQQPPNATLQLALLSSLSQGVASSGRALSPVAPISIVLYGVGAVLFCGVIARLAIVTRRMKRLEQESEQS
eukprot:2279662-Prymnesium_polylepis.2